MRLIASDIDGTLLQEGEKKIRPEVFSYIKEMREQGILFVAASGRQYDNIRKLFEPVADEIAYVCENGALTVYQGEILYESHLPKDAAMEIMEEIWKDPCAEMTISCASGYYIRPKSEKYLRLIRDEIKPTFHLIDDFSQIQEPCMKVAVFEEDGIEKNLKNWKAKFDRFGIVKTSGFGWLDIIPFGVSKAKGLQCIMEKMCISPRQCAAFGDEYNDIEMLQLVEYSYAMEHAKPAVKEAAKYRAVRAEGIMKEILEKKKEDDACTNIARNVFKHS